MPNMAYVKSIGNVQKICMNKNVASATKWIMLFSIYILLTGQRLYKNKLKENWVMVC